MDAKGHVRLAAASFERIPLTQRSNDEEQQENKDDGGRKDDQIQG